METIVAELLGVIENFESQINSLSEAELSLRPHPAKWNKKEVLGHLIDSGQNNLRRFICGQYESTPPKIVYDQDFWVLANRYDSMTTCDIISLWKLTNQRIATVLNNMPLENYGYTCDTGKNTPQFHTLEWLAQDYVKHMKHHLNQIIPGSFDIEY